jgi:hypothetical protein
MTPSPSVRLAALTSLGLLFLSAGCAADAERDDGASALAQDIVGAQRDASAYTEAVQVRVNNAANDFCTGVLVAPKVLLTAAHCVAFNPGGTWTITAPFAAGGPQTRTATSAEPMEAAFYALTRTTYDAHPELHDLGLVYLDTPFTGVGFADLSRTRYPLSGTTPSVSAVGRKTVSATAPLVLSGAVTLSATSASDGSPFDNKTTRITDGGDSGGPLFFEGTHTLVGTETRFSGSTDFWLRLDGAVFDFIASRVASHGGFAGGTLDAFRTDVSSALCARVASCCSALTPAYALDSAQCHAVYDQLGFEATAQGMLVADPGNVGVDPTARGACLARISDTADCSVSSAELKSAVTDCIAALEGKVVIGGPCKASIECAGESVCEKDAGGNGTCRALRTAGQSCQIVYTSGSDVSARDNLAQDLCSKRGGGSTGLFCDAYDHAAGAYRAEASWKCAPAKALGAPCNTDTYCASMLCAPGGEAAEFTCVADEPFVTSTLCTAFAN